MEILNQVTLAGNLTDKPSVDNAGGRVFVPARSFIGCSSMRCAGGIWTANAIRWA
jgi:hypothetical protein